MDIEGYDSPPPSPPLFPEPEASEPVEEEIVRSTVTKAQEKALGALVLALLKELDAHDEVMPMIRDLTKNTKRLPKQLDTKNITAYLLFWLEPKEKADVLKRYKAWLNL